MLLIKKKKKIWRMLHICMYELFKTFVYCTNNFVFIKTHAFIIKNIYKICIKLQFYKNNPIEINSNKILIVYCSKLYYYMQQYNFPTSILFSFMFFYLYLNLNKSIYSLEFFFFFLSIKIFI
jgi:hypothetical protein